MYLGYQTEHQKKMWRNIHSLFSLYTYVPSVWILNTALQLRRLSICVPSGKLGIKRIAERTFVVHYYLGTLPQVLLFYLTWTPHSESYVSEGFRHLSEGRTPYERIHALDGCLMWVIFGIVISNKNTFEYKVSSTRVCFPTIKIPFGSQFVIQNPSLKVHMRQLGVWIQTSEPTLHSHDP